MSNASNDETAGILVQCSARTNTVEQTNTLTENSTTATTTAATTTTTTEYY